MEEGRMEAAVNIFANRRLILFFFAKVFRDKKCIQRIWREKVWIARAKYGVARRQCVTVWPDVEMKSSPNFPKVSQKYPQQVILENWHFWKWPKKQ